LALDSKDYEPVDLTAWCNADPGSIGEDLALATGRQTYHGVPFLIGDRESSSGKCFIDLDPGRPGVKVPIGARAHGVIVAHRQLQSIAPERFGVGGVVAEYVFRFREGGEVVAPIRERFETNVIPHSDDDLDLPFRAVPDSGPEVFEQWKGPWELAGMRQREAIQGPPRSYYLWVWRNPAPERTIESLELVPGGARSLIAAVTLSHLEEHPFLRQRRRPIGIAVNRAPFTPDISELRLEVDRGVASHVHPLAGHTVSEYLSDPLTGWGAPIVCGSERGYVHLAATNSATVSVRWGDELLGSARWGQIVRDRTVKRDRVLIEVLEEGRNWVHVTVVDEDTGKPVPCRVHFQSPHGVPYQPHGHHDHINSDMGTWHVDVGGDVRLGGSPYASIDGRCQGWLPRGEVLVDVARGFEYEPVRRRIRIAPGQRELSLSIRRWTSMAKAGWFSGDSHVHFLSAQGAVMEQRAEDLHVVNLLQSQWGSLFTSIEEFTGLPFRPTEEPYVTYVSQENRQHLLGHVVLWGLKQHLMPWCSDGLSEAELGGPLETTISDWADRCREQGGTVVLAHIPRPSGETAALVATGRGDAVEMITMNEASHSEYYRFLNCGYRLPLVAGTDKMSADVPVGLYRTYAHVGDQEFSYENWCRAVRAGRTFISGGPIIRFSVDGRSIGDSVHLDGPGTVDLEATAASIFPISTLQIVQGGKVIASTHDPKGSRLLALSERVRVDQHTWFAARCGGPEYFDSLRHRDVWERGIFAHTSPIYVACGGEWSMFDPAVAQYLRTMIEGGLAYVREVSPAGPGDTLTHHHGRQDHLAFLERPFREALAAIRSRIESSSSLGS
jgi:hypothetical protein